MQELYSLTHQAALWTSSVTSTKSHGQARGTGGPLGSYLTKTSVKLLPTRAPQSWLTLTPLCMHNVLMARQRRVLHGVSTATPWSTAQIPALSNPLLPSAPSLYTYLWTRFQHRPGQYLITRFAETSTKNLQIREEVPPHPQLLGLWRTTPSNSLSIGIIQQARGPHPSRSIRIRTPGHHTPKTVLQLSIIIYNCIQWGHSHGYHSTSTCLAAIVLCSL